MSREIKFRAWNDNTKEMTTPFVWINECNLMSTRMVGAPTHTLMQYTGLKDAKGVEIYEGDVVMCYPDEFKLSYTKVVEWDNESPSLGITTNGRSGATLCKGNQDILLVIGNIHQNPELLGE